MCVMELTAQLSRERRWALQWGGGLNGPLAGGRGGEADANAPPSVSVGFLFFIIFTILNIYYISLFFFINPVGGGFGEISGV